MIPDYSFLDWSGNIGLKFRFPGTSKHLIFSVACPAEYSELRRVLRDLRASLGKRSDYYFHYTKCTPRVRRALFEASATVLFHASALIVDKRALPTEYAKMTEPDFYASLIAHLVRAAPLESVLARRLLIDAGQGKLTPLIRQVRVELSKASRERGIERPPIVRGEPAARWDGLQLADMIAGALAEGERGGIEYLGAFGDKLTVLRYPEQRPP